MKIYQSIALCFFSKTNISGIQLISLTLMACLKFLHHYPICQHYHFVQPVLNNGYYNPSSLLPSQLSLNAIFIYHLVNINSHRKLTGFLCNFCLCFYNKFIYCCVLFAPPYCKGVWITVYYTCYFI